MSLKPRFGSGMVFAVLLTFAASEIGAEVGGLDLSKALRWRHIGPFRGGRVTTVAGVSGQPRVYYQGATGGGVWKTEDAGLSWRNVSDAYFQTGSVGSIAVAPSDPDTLYVGMGEACIRSNFSHGDGVYKSVDGGESWAHMGLDDSRQIGQIRVDPEDPDRVYVAALGHVFGPNEERGVFRSTDGGSSWERVLFVDDKTGAVDLSIDSDNPRVLYAALWQVVRKPWGIEERGPGSGLYKSSDGGDTWFELTEGLPSGDKGRIGVAIAPVNPKRVWALVDADDGGLFLSEDAGMSWERVNDDFQLTRRAYYYSHVYADTQDLDTVYVLTSPFMKSTDGGKTFEFIRVPHGDNHDLWIAPEDNQRMINANDGGANVSFDGGKSWSAIDNQPTAQFYWVTTDNQFPYRVYGAQQDNSTVSIASRSNGSGITRTDWYPVGGGESGTIAPHPEDANIVYAGSYWGLLTRHDHRTGETRNISVWPEMPLGRTGAEIEYRFNWTFPIVLSPHDPGTVYVGANVLFRSTNEGQSWQEVSPDLTRNDKSKMHLGRLSDFYGTITTVVESTQERGLIWVGSDDGLVHLTRDAGRNWEIVTPAEMEDWSRVNLIEASPHDAGTAYLAVNRYHLDDFKPYVYKTHDYGKTWQRVSHGIPEGAFVRTVREDPERKGLLYAGTETGVYVSLDDGEHWDSLQLNLPAVPITDLAVKNDDLVAATQGRAFWILDDLSSLHQLTEGVLASDVHLFEPRVTYRMRTSRFRRSQAIGENPPAGVLVHFTLREKPEELTLEFLDGGGNLVKAFAGDDLPFEEGLNRFEWDMRYPDARGLEGEETFLFGGNLRGPVAVPGTYQVELRTSGGKQRQSLQIKKDPRLSSTQEEFQEQFDLLIKIRDAVSATHDGASRILSIQRELEAVMPKIESAQELNRKLVEVLSDLVELRFRGIDDQMLVYPLKLNVGIASLQRVVSSADRSPTEQTYRVFEQRSAELEAQLEKLEDILDADLPALNRLLRESGLPEIER